MEIESNQTSLPTQAVPPTSGPMFTPQQSSKPNRSLVVIIVVALLLLAMGGLGFYLFQKQMVGEPVLNRITSAIQPTSTTPAIADETANWKTITTKSWTFKVPQNLNYVWCNPKTFDLVLVGSPTASGGMFDKDKAIECNFDQPGELLSVVRELDNSQNAVIIPTNVDPKLDPVVSNTQTITVDGKAATMQQETISRGQGTGTRYKVYIRQSKSTDVLTFTDVNQKKLLDQILSTFKFVQ